MDIEKETTMLDKTFKQVLAVLNYCYQLTKNDWLGAVLGQLDWTLWEDGMPADMATYEDFMEIISKIPEADVREKAIYFVNEYYKQYTIFAIDKVVSTLEKLSQEKINALIANVN